MKTRKYLKIFTKDFQSGADMISERWINGKMPDDKFVV